MFNQDPLSANAYLTGLKYVLPLFIFLVLLASPLIYMSIGSEMKAVSADIDGIAKGATSQPIRADATQPGLFVDKSNPLMK